MTDWAALDGLAALAPHTGPFPHRGFIEAWWENRGRGDLVLIRRGEAAGAFVVLDGVVGVAGEAALTDYHTPLGSDLEGLVAEMIGHFATGSRLALDSLPLEAAEGLMKQFAAAGVSLSMLPRDTTMVLDLPDEPGAYLAGLDGKQRHEVRRKRRRFEDHAGSPRVVRDSSALPWFAAMHRTAPGDKGGFMTPEVESFFGELAGQAGGVVDVLLDGSGAPVAAAFGFEDSDTYYLYNSAFDPDRAGLSPGVVLVHELIESAIASGRTRFDFLKGDETYKVRLGAAARQLFTLEGTL